MYDRADKGIKWSAVSSVQGVQLDYRRRRRGFQVDKVMAGVEVMKEGKRGPEGLKDYLEIRINNHDCEIVVEVSK